MRKLKTYNSLRDSLPAYRRNKVQERHEILKEAADYIQSGPANNAVLLQEIDNLEKKNKTLEDQIDALQKAKAAGDSAAIAAILEEFRNSDCKAGAVSNLDVDSEDSSENSDESKDAPRKQLKPN